MNGERTITVFLAIVLATLTCFPQKDATKIELQQRSIRQKKLERYGVSRDVAKWFARLGYTDKTLKDLKSSGVDVLASIGDFYTKDERIKVVLADRIVIGTVSRINFDSSETSQYHTIVHIAVDSYLRDDSRLRKKDLQIFLESGPIIGGMIGIASDDVKFSVGERVLLFLDIGSQRVVGMSGGKYLISDGSATCLGETKLLSQILQNIESTLRTIRKTQNRN